jgi:hypothetical protein
MCFGCSRPAFLALSLLGVVVAVPGRASAQGDGPPSQTLLPVGYNFIVPAYLRLKSDFDFSQTVLHPGAMVTSDIYVITYMRAFDFGGRYAQIWINPIFGRINADLTALNRTVHTSTSGAGDAVVSFKLGIVGTPALRIPEFVKQPQVFQLSGFVSATAPVGSYNTDRLKSPYRSWQFDETTTRMPKFTAPGLGRESNRMVIDVECPMDASGVLYSLGGAAGGVTLFMDKGQLVYEYNMMIIERYQARSQDNVAPGKHRIEVVTTLTERRPLSPADVVISVDGKEVARTTVKRTVPAAFSASRRSTSGSISVRRSRSITSTGVPSASTEGSRA